MADLCEKSNPSLVSKSANYSLERCNSQLLVASGDQVNSAASLSTSLTNNLSNNSVFSSCESTKSNLSLNNSSINSSDEENNLGHLDDNQSEDNRSDEELCLEQSPNHHSDTDKETTSSDTELSSIDNKSEFFLRPRYVQLSMNLNSSLVFERSFR